MLLTLSGCVVSSESGANEPEDAANSAASESSSQQESTSQGNGPWAVGELYVASDHTVIINSVRTTVESGFSEPDNDFILLIDMTIENTGNDSHSVSSIFGFELQGSDDYMYDQDYFADTKGGLEGEIAPGSKLRGEIAFDVPELEFYSLLYSHDLFADSITFRIAASDLNIASSAAPEESNSSVGLGVGDTAEGPGFTITLNSVRSSEEDSFSGPDNDFYLILDMTIENTSDEEASVSSLASFDLKGSDLYQYSVGYFADVKGDLDGSIPAGSKLRGEVAFDVPALSFYEFTYKHDFFGSSVTFLIDESDLG